MEKPHVPADLMPSVLLCYASYRLRPDVLALIQRCDDVRKQADWSSIDRLAFEIDQLTSFQADRCDQALVRVYLGDLAWDADRLELAERSYREAQKTFSLSSPWEQRHNEAVATYGLGLAEQALGHAQKAQQSYNQALRLLQRVEKHWGLQGLAKQHEQCVNVSAHIEHLKKLNFDSSFPPGRGGGGPASAATAEKDPHPFLLGTIPPAGATDVPIDARVVLVFSRPMDRDSLRIDVQPEAGPAQHLFTDWFEADTIAVLEFARIAYGKTYQIEIVSARDKQGYLLKDGPVRRTWSFTTEVPPVLDPKARVLGKGNQPHRIPATAPFVAVFDQAMEPASLSLLPGQSLVSPNPSGPPHTWDDSHTVLIVERGSAGPNPSYQLDLRQARSKSGKPLAGTDTFDFKDHANLRLSASTNPVVWRRWPAAGQKGVPVDVPLVILFDRPVKDPEVTVQPSPGDVHTRVYAAGHVLVVQHSNLVFDQTYRVRVEVKNAAGKRLLLAIWPFRTRPRRGACTLLGVVPAEGMKDVPLGVKPVVVFSGQMDTGSGRLEIDPTPDKVSWQADPCDRIAIVNPSLSFARSCQIQAWQILHARDRNGGDVIGSGAPFSRSFAMAGMPSSLPVVESIRPHQGLLRVPVDQGIEITFSERMDPFNFEYEISPESDHSAVEWSQGDRVATIVHADLRHSETYRVTIKRARAFNGQELAAGSIPLTWSFTTVPEEPGITLCAAYPWDNDVDIPLDAPLLLMFSRRVDTLDLELRYGWGGLAKASRVALTQRWNSQYTVAEIRGNADLKPGEQCQVWIKRATSKDGHTMVGKNFAPVPNPWHFRTMDNALRPRQAPNGLDWGGLMVTALWALIVALFAALGLDLTMWHIPLQASVTGVVIFAITIILTPVIWNRWLGWPFDSPGGVVLVQAIGICALGAIVLRLWLGWAAVGGYLVAFFLSILLFPALARRRRILFTLTGSEQAIIRCQGQLWVIPGPVQTALRLPILEKLEAVVPVRPSDFTITDCCQDDSLLDGIKFSLDVQYRVVGSLNAYNCFLRSAKKRKESGRDEKALRSAWEDCLKETITASLSDALRTVSRYEFLHDQPRIERDLVQALNLRTRRIGIELQSLRIGNVKVEQPETSDSPAGDSKAASASAMVV